MGDGDVFYGWVGPLSGRESPSRLAAERWMSERGCAVLE
jgi:hypothetical protein